MRCLDDPDDWVRNEIARAFTAERVIVPVLVEGTAPIQKRALRTVPEIVRLVDLQCVQLSTKRWRTDCDGIMALLADHGAEPPTVAPVSTPPVDPTASSPTTAGTWTETFLKLGLVAMIARLMWVQDRGQERKQAGDRAQAATDFSEVIADGPKYLGTLRDLQAKTAGNAQDEELRKKGIDQLQALVMKAYSGRVDVRRADGDIEGALTDCDAAIELLPEHPRAYVLRAELRQGTGDLIGALADFDRAVARVPEDAALLTQRGLLQERRGDLMAAREDYRNAIRLDPHLPDRMYGDGQRCEKAGDLEGALKKYDDAIRLSPDHAGALQSRAAVREQHGDTGGSLKDRLSAFEASARGARRT